MVNIFPSTSIIDGTTEGFGAAGSLTYHYMPRSKNVLSTLQCFLGKIRASPDCHIPSLILSSILIQSILWLPLSVYISSGFLLLSLPPSPPLFCSHSGSCLGPLGPDSYQLVMGPGGSGPRPWTQTDWLASYLHSGRRVPFPPLYAAVLSELGQTEKNAAREQIITKHTHKHTHTHWDTGTHTSIGRIYLIKFIIIVNKVLAIVVITTACDFRPCFTQWWFRKSTLIF